MNIVVSLAAASVCAVGLMGCASKPLIEELALTEPMPTIDRPVFQVGMTTHQVDPNTGEKSSWRIESIAENGEIDSISSDGCEWRKDPEWFPGVLKWNNCGTDPKWKSGTREILSSEGSLWPLAVGNTVRYKYRIVNAAGKKKLQSEVCDVKTAAHINVAIGEIDAYRIDCERRNGDWSQTRSWYWSPEHGEVKYVRRNSDDGVKRNVDVTRKEFAAVSN